MAITLYDSLTKTKKDLQELMIDGKISLYGCGVTVYDHCHIGHGRVFVVYDLLVRYLKAQNINVLSARNITDIDDKIIKKAQDLDQNFFEITKKYTSLMHKDIEALGCLAVDHEPRATDHIETMIKLIEQLVQNEYAYVCDGEVFFHVEKFKEYGKLSGQNLQDLNFGNRVEAREQKKHPADFTLWKPAKDGEPSWPSPWGEGRPGWHIECSAMIESIFAQTLSIHLGGADLKFPHHENEIAQSECCFQRPLAALWLHIGFVQVKSEQSSKNEKMSKSLGNFVTLKDILSHYCPNTCRLFYLATHYRQPLVYSQENFEQAKNTYQSIYQSLAEVHDVDDLQSQAIFKKLLEALDDDLNFPKALALLYNLLKKYKGSDKFLSELSGLKQFCERVMGLSFASIKSQEAPENIRLLAQKRAEFRAAKEWQKADQCRDEIFQLGWDVLDRAEGFELKKVT